MSCPAFLLTHRVRISQSLLQTTAKPVNVHQKFPHKPNAAIKLPAGGAPPRSRGVPGGEQPPGSKSLYILNLLSNLFNLAFYVNHYAGNTDVLSLGAYGVGFTIKLLNEEVKLSAYRLGGVKH